MQQASRKWQTHVGKQEGKEHRHDAIRDQERPAMKENIEHEDNDVTC